MNNLYKKLNSEADHIRLTADEKRAMRLRIFGVPSPVKVVRSPYVFFASHRLLAALTALVLVVFAGGSSAAYAAQSALPGEPLYALKTRVLERAAVALASTPTAKAAVHVALAQRRVDEAEVLAQKGALNATTSAELVANFESNAESADAIAVQLADSDPAAAVQIKTELSASSAVGGAVLAALGNQGHNREDKEHTDALALRVAARAKGEKTIFAASSARGTSAVAPQTPVRTMAVTTDTAPAAASAEPEASVGSAQEATARRLEQKARDALSEARAQFAVASSSLGTTTVEVQATLTGIESLIDDGVAALDGSLYDTAVKDFTQAFGRGLRLQALLKAQRTFDNRTIMPLLKFDAHEGGDDR